MRLFLHPLHLAEWNIYHMEGKHHGTSGLVGYGFNPLTGQPIEGAQSCHDSVHERRGPYVVFHPGIGVVCTWCRKPKLAPFVRVSHHYGRETFNPWA